MATVSALQSVGLPAAVMSAGGQVVATNGLFEALPSIFMPLAYNRLAIADPKADILFQESVRSTSAATAPIVRSIPVRQRIDRDAVVLHVMPVRRSARDIFAGANILVIAATISTANKKTSPQILSALFDLSPSEARLAGSLASGLTLKAAAVELGITVKTARTYLERVFRKTGTSRQGELVALLSGTAPLAPFVPAPKP
ncbi:helix-turn-helix transcriptional regulator [Mesorhizobium sp. M7A.F.Ca.US.010.02.1.1]|uniref:helix-turn-helix transcriptional regulator n=1 Tax=Mesorhizobium sp. M7A.F.Ca.US.010.02.1.1 TaxID=2496743 RepID=UPI001FDF1420|nr:helix-turn-helix transcriptional regulator [Mesorhizobium sp. M7A.F.Ca.US.010.02.1.1]